MKDMLHTKHYRFGLAWPGILAVVLVMLPNLLYAFYTPPNDVLRGNEAANWLWNALETVGRFGLMITLCIIVHSAAPAKSRVVTIGAIVSLLAYYALWAAYFAGTVHALALVGLAVFPSVFFLLTAWRQKNGFAFAFSALFAIVHICITWGNFLL